MIELIGNVKLNLEYYCGKDLYSDGDVEDELLDIVKHKTRQEYMKVILEKNSWPILYHLSEIRHNILNWFPFKKEDTVMEIGAGCGAITECLVEKVAKVTAIELSKKRSLINAYRNNNADNLEIIVGNFNEIADRVNEKYDYITLIGVFEYSESYIQTNDPYKDFLNKINRMLKPGGKIIIAIENRFGLKYFAGCTEDHVGRYFEGIEGYSNTAGVKTFNKSELISLFNDGGFYDYEFYYPYPDYKLPEIIFSDKRLPNVGELVKNLRNFDTDRFILFDETKAFNSIIKSGMFPEFSNSFLVFLNKKDDSNGENNIF